MWNPMYNAFALGNNPVQWSGVGNINMQIPHPVVNHHVIRPAPPSFAQVNIPAPPPEEEKPPLPAEPPPEEPPEPPMEPRDDHEAAKLSTLQQQAQQWQQHQQYENYQKEMQHYQQRIHEWNNGGRERAVEAIQAEEKTFNQQYTDWKQQYQNWKNQNQNHPNQEQFKQYEAQWKEYEMQMETRRQDLNRRKAEIERQNSSMPPQNISSQQYGGKQGNPPMGRQHTGPQVSPQTMPPAGPQAGPPRGQLPMGGPKVAPPSQTFNDQHAQFQGDHPNRFQTNRFPGQNHNQIRQMRSNGPHNTQGQPNRHIGPNQRFINDQRNAPPNEGNQPTGNQPGGFMGGSGPRPFGKRNPMGLDPRMPASNPNAPRSLMDIDVGKPQQTGDLPEHDEQSTNQSSGWSGPAFHASNAPIHGQGQFTGHPGGPGPRVQGPRGPGGHVGPRSQGPPGPHGSFNQGQSNLGGHEAKAPRHGLQDQHHNSSPAALRGSQGGHFPRGPGGPQGSAGVHAQGPPRPGAPWHEQAPGPRGTAPSAPRNLVPNDGQQKGKQDIAGNNRVPKLSAKEAWENQGKKYVKDIAKTAGQSNTLPGNSSKKKNAWSGLIPDSFDSVPLGADLTDLVKPPQTGSVEPGRGGRGRGGFKSKGKGRGKLQSENQRDGAQRGKGRGTTEHTRGSRGRGGKGRGGRHNPHHDASKDDQFATPNMAEDSNHEYDEYDRAALHTHPARSRGQEKPDTGKPDLPNLDFDLIKATTADLKGKELNTARPGDAREKAVPSRHGVKVHDYAHSEHLAESDYPIPASRRRPPPPEYDDYRHYDPYGPPLPRRPRYDPYVDPYYHHDPYRPYPPPVLDPYGRYPPPPPLRRYPPEYLAYEAQRVPPAEIVEYGSKSQVIDYEHKVIDYGHGDDGKKTGAGREEKDAATIESEVLELARKLNWDDIKSRPERDGSDQAKPWERASSSRSVEDLPPWQAGDGGRASDTPPWEKRLNDALKKNEEQMKELDRLEAERRRLLSDSRYSPSRERSRDAGDRSRDRGRDRDGIDRNRRHTRDHEFGHADRNYDRSGDANERDRIRNRGRHRDDLELRERELRLLQEDKNRERSRDLRLPREHLTRDRSRQIDKRPWDDHHDRMDRHERSLEEKLNTPKKQIIGGFSGLDNVALDDSMLSAAATALQSLQGGFSSSPRPHPDYSQPDSITVDELMCSPGREKRPEHIAVILRGLPGSGKSYAAKLLKDKEVSSGGKAPRVMSLDDYFIVENEKDVRDPESGRITRKSVLEYEFDSEMEKPYVQSLLKSFKKQIDNLHFSFIIVDSVFEKVSSFEPFWGYAKSKGFQVYISELQAEPNVCTKRNIHGRTHSEIQQLHARWEKMPSYMCKLDLRTLLQEDEIEEVEMEESDPNDPSTSDVSKEQEGEDLQSGEDSVMQKSRWDLDTSERTLDKLDGVSVAKYKHHKKEEAMSIEDYLSLADEYSHRASAPGKKRVRWADLEERKDQARSREIGFVVGQTDWNRMMDDTYADKLLNRTKYI